MIFERGVGIEDDKEKKAEIKELREALFKIVEANAQALKAGEPYDLRQGLTGIADKFGAASGADKDRVNKMIFYLFKKYGNKYECGGPRTCMGQNECADDSISEEVCEDGTHVCCIQEEVLKAVRCPEPNVPEPIEAFLTGGTEMLKVTVENPEKLNGKVCFDQFFVEGVQGNKAEIEAYIKVEELKDCDNDPLYFEASTENIATDSHAFSVVVHITDTISHKCAEWKGEHGQKLVYKLADDISAIKRKFGYELQCYTDDWCKWRYGDPSAKCVKNVCEVREDVVRQVRQKRDKKRGFAILQPSFLAPKKGIDLECQLINEKIQTEP